MVTAGLVLVFALTGVLTFASFAVASRLTRPGADSALAVCMLVSAGILTPIHALGFAHLLTAAHLTWASLLTSAGLFMCSKPGRTVADHARETVHHTRATFGRFASLLLVDVRRAGPIAWAAALALAFTLIFTTMLTWLIPSDSWDGTWYHDMMVGHAVWSHSYEEIPMARSYMQQANGHPRNGEMLGLWWAIFSGRRLLEWPSVLATVPMALACYGLCRRYAPNTLRAATQSRWRAAAFLTATALILLPAFRLELRTTYIDGILGCFSLTAVYFASDPRLTAKRSVLAALAIGLALGSKSHALLSMPFLAMLALGIVLVNEGARGWRRSVAAFFGSVVVIVVLGGVTYIRNYLWYHDPFYPFTVSVGPWHFEGLFVLADDTRMNDVSADLFMLPVQGADWPDLRRGGYGLINGFVVLPIAGIAFIALAVSFVRHFARSVGQRRPLGELGERAVLLLTTLTVVFSLYTSPQLWSARYNLYAVGFGFALVHWTAAILRTSALASHFGAAAFVTNVMLWSWSVPGWWYQRGWREFKTLLAQPRSADVGAPSWVEPATARAREREQKAGDVVVFSDDVGFASLLWNESFSNHLLYVPPLPPAQYLTRADDVHAKWIAVSIQNSVVPLLRERTTDWSEVGMLHKWGDNKTLVFRRIPPQN